MKLISVLALFFSLSAFANSPVGRWKTIDDETKKEKSIVEITEKDGMLYGKVVQLFRPADQDQNPKCDKCSGDKKDQPILGMEILWDLKADGENKWENGHIMDPNNGKTYKCKMKLIENGEKLEVRGFIGFSMLGRTQTWLKAETPPPPPPAPVETTTPEVKTKEKSKKKTK